MAVGESRDVPCVFGLASTVDGHFGVEFGDDKWFLTDWQSNLSDFPLPSRNWYHAVPNRNPISTDGTARWENAEIQVHCWVYRALYLFQRHYDVIAASGRLVELCDDRERIDIEAGDDGGTVPNSATLSACSGDGGGGGGGGGTVVRCYTLTIEHYWYYPDTGQIEYRYTEMQTYCEQSE